MSVNEKPFSIIARSFIAPNEFMDGFALGEDFEFHFSGAITVGEFTRSYFYERETQIGMITINGQISLTDAVLREGDRIDLYPLLEGG
jgi:hypothetical protein